MSANMGPCGSCGTSWVDCAISIEAQNYTTDPNGNHYGLCCPSCQHLAAGAHSEPSDGEIAARAAESRGIAYGQEAAA
jgi:hypothetical protein